MKHALDETWRILITPFVAIGLIIGILVIAVVGGVDDWNERRKLKKDVSEGKI